MACTVAATMHGLVAGTFSWTDSLRIFITPLVFLFSFIFVLVDSSIVASRVSILLTNATTYSLLPLEESSRLQNYLSAWTSYGCTGFSILGAIHVTENVVSQCVGLLFLGAVLILIINL